MTSSRLFEMNRDIGTNGILNGAGERCDNSIQPLLSSIRESFPASGADRTVWKRIQGGSVSAICGTVDSGTGLHFHEVFVLTLFNIIKLRKILFQTVKMTPICHFFIEHVGKKGLSKGYRLSNQNLGRNHAERTELRQ